MQARDYPLHRTATSRFLDLLYCQPNPLESEDAFEMFAHADLSRRTKADLKRELARLEHRLLFDNGPPSWLTERQGLLKDAISNAR